MNGGNQNIYIYYRKGKKKMGGQTVEIKIYKSIIEKVEKKKGG